MRRSVAVVIVTLAVVGISLTARTRARTRTFESAPRVQQVPGDVLPALLTEVRGLRAAMEKMASAGPRVQLALGRVQLQEQRINNAIRRLDEVRAAVAQAQGEYDRLREALGAVEGALRDPRPDGPPIEQLKMELEVMPRRIAPALAKLQRATADEGALSADLANEQARWTDLNQRMEALEATLGTK